MERETLDVDILVVGGGPAGLSAALRLTLFDVAGRWRAAHDLGARPAGAGSFLLPAADASGAPLPAGTYFYRLSGSTATRTGRIVVAGE